MWGSPESPAEEDKKYEIYYEDYFEYMLFLLIKNKMLAYGDIFKIDVRTTKNMLDFVKTINSIN
jgi:hypothetical protein